ncbi:TPA: aminomethyl-transferring glycine dehydrogenase subunit GcvPA [Candidatus Poribacteria bacterium]|nr:aminomethyl-transferring glycine dehydrogenase subunit GcvPA [Candidatus Poribacteria bacterium]
MNYISNTDAQRQEMLHEIGVDSFEELLRDIPEELRNIKLNLSEGLSELELIKSLRELSERNADLNHYTSYLGAGAYDHFIPSVVKTVISRGEFYTSYTPYQPEVSQGTLQAVYEYQSLICELTGMDVSNASLYDGASALGEAAILTLNATNRAEIVVSKTVHPEYRAVLKTYLRGLGAPIHEIPYTEDGTTDLEELKNAVNENTASVILQNPNFFGCIERMSKSSEITHSNDALFVACVNPISLGVLKPPGEYGADLAVGEGQPLGNPIAFGGPYLGFFATTQKLMRKLPGRIVGQTKDTEGRRGFVLTLQAREQHIRREKATSNICTNQALNALAACVYLSAMGKSGVSKVARLNLQKSHYAQERLCELDGFELKFSAPPSSPGCSIFFNEFLIQCNSDPNEINKKLLNKKIIGGLPVERFYPELKNCVLFCVTEMRTKEEIDTLVATIGKRRR